ncbi:hypothetical protein V2J09_003310 [Rumex salicifolius]
MKVEEQDPCSCYSGCLGNISELSATDTACERSVLTLVYERTKFKKKPKTSAFPRVSLDSTPSHKGFVYWRKKHYNRAVLFPTTKLENSLPKDASVVCPSIESEKPSLVEKHNDDQTLHEIEGVRSSMSTVICTDEPVFVHSEANDGCLAEQHDSNEKGNGTKIVEVYSVDDSCSSSMVNINTGSALVKTEVEENGECSSLGAYVGELMGEDISAEDLCISILKSHKLLSCLLPNDSCTSEDEVASCSRFDNSCECSVCGLMGTAEMMLLCDQCDKAVHVSCCSPTSRNISFDEWFCQCCLKKRQRKMGETNRKRSKVIRSDLMSAVTEAKTSSIAAMLNDSDPYTTGVRIGKDFQAVVPCWSGPLTKNSDVSLEPVEVDPFEMSTCHKLSSEQLSKRKPIGNWVQCRDVIVGLGERDGYICGKWRRAPLFEVQTDDWDCFRSVLWDPAHADCAVPQELETDEVLRQLKYMEMLKPRLEAKKMKLDTMEVRHKVVEEMIQTTA